MKIGIVGTGNMGGALGTRWARNGHSVFFGLCSDDAAAKGTVKELAEELGFVGIDCGPLERSRVVDGATDFLRFQIGGMGLGPFATLSLNVVRAPGLPSK